MDFTGGLEETAPLPPAVRYKGAAHRAESGALEIRCSWNEALEKLQTQNERLAHVVELRYFGGLQLEEIAAAQSISLPTVKRHLALGQACSGER